MKKKQSFSREIYGLFSSPGFWRIWCQLALLGGPGGWDAWTDHEVCKNSPSRRKKWPPSKQNRWWTVQLQDGDYVAWGIVPATFLKQKPRREGRAFIWTRSSMRFHFGIWIMSHSHSFTEKMFWNTKALFVYQIWFEMSYTVWRKRVWAINHPKGCHTASFSSCNLWIGGRIIPNSQWI